MIRYLVTITLSSFLLFLVQPLIARLILPWFGGGASVWGVCLVFFQTLLLGGYLYSHVSAQNLPPKRQGVGHLVLLGLSLLALPILPPAFVRPDTLTRPTLQILLLLLVTIGLPYLVLSTTAPLVQHWYSRETGSQSPYRLYALSNAASLGALLAYPFLIEPHIPLRAQVYAWSGLYALFVGVAGYTVVRYIRAAPAPVDRGETDGRPRAGSLITWTAWAFTGTLLLVAITSKSTQDIPPIPFLWILYLTLYLVSFILTFESDRWYNPGLFIGLFAVMLVIASLVSHVEKGIGIAFRIVVFALTLFSATMVAHGELARSRPRPAHLTWFYLMVSLGGALGGIFVSLVAPLIFDRYMELELGLGFLALLVALALVKRSLPLPRRGVRIAAVVAVTLVSWGALARSLSRDRPALVARERNFYGVLSVERDVLPGGPAYNMRHGRVVHGSQLLDPVARRLPIAYYSHRSGLGKVLLGRDTYFKGPVEVGVVGLGVGTIAAYGRPGDRFTFYEINPMVVDYARRYFRYLRDSRARVEVTLGDARIELSRHLRQGRRYHVLVLDAFSGDSVPMHLMTVEAMALYRSMLHEGGILAFHTSNMYLNLHTLVRNVAARNGLDAYLLYSKGDLDRDIFPAYWVLATARPDLSAVKEVKALIRSWPKPDHDTVWTDDYGSLLHLIR